MNYASSIFTTLHRETMVLTKAVNKRVRIFVDYSCKAYLLLQLSA